LAYKLTFNNLKGCFTLSRGLQTLLGAESQLAP